MDDISVIEKAEEPVGAGATESGGADEPVWISARLAELHPDLDPPGGMTATIGRCALAYYRERYGRGADPGMRLVAGTTDDFKVRDYRRRDLDLIDIAIADVVEGWGTHAARMEKVRANIEANMPDDAIHVSEEIAAAGGTPAGRSEWAFRMAVSRHMTCLYRERHDDDPPRRSAMLGKRVGCVNDYRRRDRDLMEQAVALARARRRVRRKPRPHLVNALVEALGNRTKKRSTIFAEVRERRRYSADKMKSGLQQGVKEGRIRRMRPGYYRATGVTAAEAALDEGVLLEEIASALVTALGPRQLDRWLDRDRLFGAKEVSKFSKPKLLCGLKHALGDGRIRKVAGGYYAAGRVVS